MPIVTVSLLPEDLSQADLEKIYGDIVAAVVSVKALGLTKSDVTVRFPPDRMIRRRGSEIIIEITGLFEKPERNSSVRTQLATVVGQAIKELHPESIMVEGFVIRFNPVEGFWTSVE